MNISDGDREVLELFCTKAKEISNTSIFQEKKYNTSLTFGWKQGEGFHSNVVGPEKEALIALVASLRQCYAQKEPIYFRRVKNIVWGYVANGEERVKECVVSAEKAFNEILDNPRLPMEFQIGGENEQPLDKGKKRGIPVVINGKVEEFTPQKIIDVWFNANIFHADVEKIKMFREMLESPFAPFFDFVFKTAIMELANVIIYFGKLIEIELLSSK